MSDIMLHGVLNMPPKLWCDSPIDVMQRHSRYVQASQYIDELDAELTAAREEIAILKSKYADHHSEAERITSEIRAVTSQRDEWKANHDNQVSINQLLRDRPDLKDRAASVDKLIEQRDSLQKVLKDCLYAMPCSYVPNHTVANLPSMIASQAQMLGEECNRADALEKQIEKMQLTLSPEQIEIKRLRRVLHDISDTRPDEHMDIEKNPELVKWICDTWRKASVGAYPPEP